MKILVTYASKHGATAEIAEFIAGVMRKKPHEVDCLEIKQVENLQAYDGILIGTAIYAGMWMGDVIKFLREHESTLARKRVWVFASGPVGEGEPETLLDGDFIPANARILLEAINPDEIVLFHGKVDFEKLAWAERLILRAIGTPVGDYRDMEAIQAWAAKVAKELAPQTEI